MQVSSKVRKDEEVAVNDSCISSPLTNAASVAWINGSQFEDTLTDWGYRANQMSLQLAEDVIDTFYGKTEGVRLPKDNGRIARYYVGSSNGAGRGLAAL
jgi:hypothetical protein